MTFLSWRDAGNELGVGVRRTALCLQNSLHCYIFLSTNMLVGNGLSVNSIAEKGSSTFHALSHILTWLHFSKRFLFSCLFLDLYCPVLQHMQRQTPRARKCNAGDEEIGPLVLHASM